MRRHVRRSIGFAGLMQSPHLRQAVRMNVVAGGAPAVRRRHDLFAAIAPEQRYEVQALLRAGTGRRASAFLSSAMLRRSASMRLVPP